MRQVSLVNRPVCATKIGPLCKDTIYGGKFATNANEYVFQSLEAVVRCES